MTCVRLLEILPIIFGKVCPLPDGVSGNSSNKLQTLSNFSWLNDLIDWGKSSLEAVIRYWKQSVTSLLVLLKSSCNEKSIAIVTCIEKMISSGELVISIVFISFLGCGHVLLATIVYHFLCSVVANTLLCRGNPNGFISGASITSFYFIVN